MTRFVFLGPPGAGKGTQARQGLEAKRYMDRGVLVPDGVVIRMIADRLARADAKLGFILDGFPRTPEQAAALDELLADAGQGLDRVVFFDVDEPEIVRRLTGRRVCPSCGSLYHLVSSPPRVANRCDRCGSELILRDDDREETVRTRLGVYARQTAPLLERYRERGLLVSVPAGGEIDTVHRALRTATGVAP